jgi:hypothetical protein
MEILLISDYQRVINYQQSIGGVNAKLYFFTKTVDFTHNAELTICILHILSGCFVVLTKPARESRENRERARRCDRGPAPHKATVTGNRYGKARKQG